MKKFRLILNLANSNGKFFAIFVAALCFLSFLSVSAQQTPKPKDKVKVIPAPTPDTKTPLPTIVTPLPRPLPTPPPESKRVVVNEADTPAEKSILTESKITVSLCVKEGNVRINGWDRDEVRAYVEDGSQVGFKVVQDNPKNKKPVWVAVLGFDPKKTKELKPEECLSGSEIELDVPRNTNVKLESVESEVKIDSLSRVSVKTLSGGIFLNNIANGVDATTYRGDLTLEKSGGQVTLNNTEGNIIALEVAPSEIGDSFKAKTNSGRIMLKAVEHRQIETNSISGSTSYDGALLGGGQYTFSTQNGSIGLTVPTDSSCKINATFGFGAFSSEIPLQNTLKKEQSLSAQIGAGETTCALNLKTGSGVIRIRNGKAPVKMPENVKKNSDKNTKTVATKKTSSKSKTVSKNIKPRNLQSVNRKPRVKR